MGKSRKNDERKMKEIKRKMEIEIGDKTYPMYPTMGAFLIFKTETGHDISKMEQGDMADTVAYLYSCVKAACKREGVEFALTLEEFANDLTMEDIEAATERPDGGKMAKSLDEGQEGSKKKRAR